ncbi:uncharacterized protein TNCT_301101 [Trichonephila clavata]|uniref:Uncharacterized protein n=1 Tax=Trichonephila clavata TaxID=2740835 RepID=A0A8X6I8D2_TRICU|nr:uncharacterized protein TNCT_301101 [Trichonephila clavata]
MKIFRKINFCEAPKSVTEDIWLQWVINIFGLRNHALTFPSYFRNILSPFSLFLHVSFLYSAVVLVLHKQAFSTKRTLFDIISVSLSVVIWQQIQMQSNKICDFCTELKKLPGHLVLLNVKEKRAFQTAILISFLFPSMVSVALISAVVSNDLTEYKNVWLFGKSIFRNKILDTLVAFICMLAFFSSKFLIPLLSTVVYSFYSYILSNAIRNQNENIVKAVNTKILPIQIKMYYRIVECCRLFDNCGKVTIFLLIFMYCCTLYTALGHLLRESTRIPGVILMIEGIFTTFSFVLFAVSLLIFASEIPKAMFETRKEFQRLYRYYLLEEVSISGKHLKLIKALRDTEPFYLTAWDFFRIDKGLILSLFGAALSFCLLIMQLKKVNLDTMGNL